jgi:hypothetical protein
VNGIPGNAMEQLGFTSDTGRSPIAIVHNWTAALKSDPEHRARPVRNPVRPALMLPIVLRRTSLVNNGHRPIAAGRVVP